MGTSTTRFTDGRQCPFCGEKNDGATDPYGSEGQPRAGDCSICLYCVEVAIFCEGGLRKPTLAELRKIEGDRSVQIVRERIIEMNRQQPN
jgi:hypothetical protein